MILGAIIHFIKSAAKTFVKVCSWLLAALSLWVPVLYSVIFFTVLGFSDSTFTKVKTGYFAGLILSIVAAFVISSYLYERKRNQKEQSRSLSQSPQEKEFKASLRKKKHEEEVNPDFLNSFPPPVSEYASNSDGVHQDQSNQYGQINPMPQMQNYQGYNQMQTNAQNGYYPQAGYYGQVNPQAAYNNQPPMQSNQGYAATQNQSNLQQYPNGQMDAPSWFFEALQRQREAQSAAQQQGANQEQPFNKDASALSNDPPSAERRSADEAIASFKSYNSFMPQPENIDRDKHNYSPDKHGLEEKEKYPPRDEEYKIFATRADPTIIIYEYNDRLEYYKRTRQGLIFMRSAIK